MQDLGQSHWRCYSMYASSELFHVEPKSPGFWSCPQGWWLSAVKWILNELTTEICLLGAGSKTSFERVPFHKFSAKQTSLSSVYNLLWSLATLAQYMVLGFLITPVPKDESLSISYQGFLPFWLSHFYFSCLFISWEFCITSFSSSNAVTYAIYLGLNATK